MIYNHSIMLYELSDVIDIEDDDELLNQYKEYLIDMKKKSTLPQWFEWISKLPKDTLAKFRLEYRPRTKGFYASLHIIQRKLKYNSCLIVKNEYLSVPSYRVTGF